MVAAFHSKVLFCQIQEEQCVNFKLLELYSKGRVRRGWAVNAHTSYVIFVNEKKPIVCLQEA